MKLTGNEQVNTMATPGFNYPDGSYEIPVIKYGLTIRQYFAAMALQGILANDWKNQLVPFMVQDAFYIADEMIKENNKQYEDGR